jgi:hypothetical protein
MRQGKTFATNGGPVFPFWTIDGKEPGESVPVADRGHRAAIEIHSLYPLKSAQLIRRGNVIQTFDVAGRQGEVRLEHSFKEAEPSWYVLRVEDDRGNWAITSPIWFEPARPLARGFASALLFEISNHTRFIQLRKDFFAHMIVTVGPDDAIAEVELLKDGAVLRSFKPGDGNQLAGGKIPATEREGEYGPGWIWHPNAERAVHFQADWPVIQSGWYSIRLKTAGNRRLVSGSIHFDSEAVNSHALSVAKLAGNDSQFVLWGYGEEMPLADIRLPFAGDRWWYPARTGWQIQASFGGRVHELRGGSKEAMARFRSGN